MSDAPTPEEAADEIVTAARGQPESALRAYVLDALRDAHACGAAEMRERAAALAREEHDFPGANPASGFVVTAKRIEAAILALPLPGSAPKAAPAPVGEVRQEQHRGE